MPDPIEKILGGADARFGRAFNKALEIMEAVGVLARERQVPGRLAKPTFHRSEVARLVAGVAPQHVGLGGPVCPREELTIEEWYGCSRRPGKDVVVPAKKAHSV